MAEEQLMGYGYASDDVKPFNLHFGLNNNTQLLKFEFNPNAGKDNTAGEAIDLTFNIGGTERNLRLFPVDPDKVYDKDRKQITNKKSPEYAKAYNESVKALGAMVTHVLHCYTDDHEGVKAALSKPFTSFKQYALAAKALLPSNFPKVDLDIFLQYQWNVTQGKNTTYLEIPRAMKHGKWLCRSVEPVGGVWKEERYEEQNSGEPEKALRYVDEAGNKHPFTKSAWFMSSKFAKRTNAEGEEIEPSAQTDAEDAAAGAAMNQEPASQEAGVEAPAATGEESNW